MKSFRIETDVVSITFHNACDVEYFIKSNKLQDYVIEWKTPVTGEYATLIRVENGKKVYETPHFELPTVFKKIK